jgi:hypothetical protein
VKNAVASVNSSPIFPSSTLALKFHQKTFIAPATAEPAFLPKILSFARCMRSSSLMREIPEGAKGMTFALCPSEPAKNDDA